MAAYPLVDVKAKRPEAAPASRLTVSRVTVAEPVDHCERSAVSNDPLVTWLVWAPGSARPASVKQRATRADHGSTGQVPATPIGYCERVERRPAAIAVSSSPSSVASVMRPVKRGRELEPSETV